MDLDVRHQRVGQRGGYTPGMDLDDLPDGLPPGQLVAPDPRHNPRWTGGPVYWASRQPLPDAPQQWARLQAIQDRTGLRPLLLGYPDDYLQPCDRSQIDALDAETLLLREWRAFVRLREEVTANPPSMEEVPDDVVIPDDPGPPFATWPGLAPPGAAGRDADAAARQVVARRVPSRLPATFQAYLGLVPATRSADIPALIGTNAATNYLRVADLSAVLRSWEDRFGARVIALTDALYLSVAGPPLTREHAEHVALEHLLLCPDILAGDPAWTFPSYVDLILGVDLWRFWWD